MKKILVIGAVVLLGLVVGSAVLFKFWLLPTVQESTNSGVVEPRPAQATILAAKETGLIVDQLAGVRLRLEVRPAQGEPFQVTVTRAVSRFDLAQYKPGATLKINYDKQNRSRVELTSTPQLPASQPGN